jgi:hypothetical protein
MELQSKFIEGTNEQYSIRNDGVVIRHCKLVYNSKLKQSIFVYKEFIPKLSINKQVNAVTLSVKIGQKKRNIYIRKAVADAFNLYNPYVNTGTCLVIGHKDGNLLNCSLDNLYYTGKSRVTLSTSFEDKIENRRIKNNSYKSKSYRNLSAEKLAERYEYIVQWQEQNTAKFLKAKKKSNSRVIKDLDKSYVAAKLRVSVNDLTEDLYQAGMTRIKLKRKIKQISKENGKT